MSLSFITNNLVKIATYLLLEFREALRPKSVTWQGCNIRGLGSTIHIPVFPCSSHLALPPSTAISLQRAHKTQSTRFFRAPVWDVCPPSHTDAHLHCSTAQRYRSSPVKRRALPAGRNWLKASEIPVLSVSQSPQHCSPPAHVAGKPQAPRQPCVWCLFPRDAKDFPHLLCLR